MWTKLRACFPPLHWLSQYRSEFLARDAVAGATLAAYGIPVSLAYASLAGLPPHYGIYCYLAGGLGYALFGSSRQLAIGPTSAISMLVGVSVASMAGSDTGRIPAIAALAALMVALLGLIAWLFHLSGLVSFISETILTGFKAGAALTIGLTQLPKLFGVPGGGEHFFERLWTLGSQLSQTNLVVLVFGFVAIALLVAGDKWFPGRPVPLVVVALSIAVVSLTNLTSQGITIVGALPAGLPHFAWPSLRPQDVDGIVPLAGACFLLAYVEGVSAARTLAAQHDYEIDPRQELLALGAANLAAAFSQGFPVAGGLSQSAVNDKAGAQTPLALVFCSTTIALCLLFFSSLLSNLPNVVLAAIVLVAVKGLIDVAALRRLWRVSRVEFSVALVALAGVLLLGILKGVLLAVVVSLLMLLAATAQPNVAFLGRIPGTRRYSDRERHPSNEAVPGVLIFRVEAPLLYFNVDHVFAIVRERVNQAADVRLVVCDLSNAPYVDVAGAGMLKKLYGELAKRRIHLRIVEARSRSRDLLRAEGLEQQVGHMDRSLSVDQVIEEFNQSAQPA